jgi:hypothetical protein
LNLEKLPYSFNIRYSWAAKNQFMSLLSKKKQKSSKASAFSVRIGYVLGGFLGFLLLFQMIQFYQLRDKLQFLDGLQESQSSVVEQVSLSQNYLTQFATDLNQIREFLLLPESDYDFSELGEAAVEEEEADLTTQIFELVDALGAAEQNAVAYDSRLINIQDYLSVSDSVFNKGVTFDSIGVEGLEGVTWELIDNSTGETFLKIELAYDAEVNLTYLGGGGKYSTSVEFSLISEDIDELMLGVEEFRSSVAAHRNALAFLEGTLFPSENFQNYLNTEKLSLSSKEENANSSFYNISNSDGTLLASFQVWKGDFSTMLIIPNPVDGFAEEKWIDLSLDEFGQDLALSSLESLLDTRTALDLKLEERRNELAQVMLDRGFISTLEALGLTMGEVIEEEGRLYYSILNAEGEVLRNLVLDFTTGEVTVELPENGAAESLALAIENLKDTGKKKLSTYLS